MKRFNWLILYTLALTFSNPVHAQFDVFGVLDVNTLPLVTRKLSGEDYLNHVRLMHYQGDDIESISKGQFYVIVPDGRPYLDHDKFIGYLHEDDAKQLGLTMLIQ